VNADRFDNAFDIPDYFMVPEAKNVVTLPLQKSRPYPVGIVIMLSAVDLGDQSILGA
jgi:hypothetical protein